MSSTELFSEGALTIDQAEQDTSLTLLFSGKSIIRNANNTLQPVVLDAMQRAQQANRRLILDFRGLSYMNSSSFAPLIKVLEKARLESVAVSVIYSTGEKWQVVSFSALTIFQTQDGRISITGADNERTEQFQ